MVSGGVAGRIRTAVAEATREAGPPGWVRPVPDREQMRRDVGLALLLAVTGMSTVVLGRAAGILTDHRPAVGEELAWTLAVALPLGLRRRHPQSVLVVVGIAFIGLQARGVGESVASQLSLLIAMYTVGAWGRDRVLARWTRGLVVAVMFGWLVWSLSTYAWDGYLSTKKPDGPLPAVLAVSLLYGLINVLYFGGVWAGGDLAWRSASQRALLEQRTVELARERDENARRAVLDERIRIARELHDVVAHHVSVMGVQAGAARVVLDADPGAARTALGGIEHSARQAVEEMRRLLGVLRGPMPLTGTDAEGTDGDGPAAPLPPAPALDDLPALVTATGSAGLRARYTVVGDPLPVPPGLGVSVYRIVQEALTNTVRHAGAASVDVRLRYLTEPGPAVEAEIVDDGRAPVDGAGFTATSRGPGRGLGLVGMRERAALHEGRLETGPRPAGGYRVRVRFPLPAGTAPSAPAPAGAASSVEVGR